MSKRQYPFDGDLSRQTKVRVGQKEYDERHDNKMSAVHNKTLRKLFNGSKEFYEPNGNYMKNYYLASAGIETSDNKLVSEYCSTCNELNVIEVRCSFCDKMVCRECGLPCIRCNDLFCPTHGFKLHIRNTNCICYNCVGKNSP